MDVVRGVRDDGTGPAAQRGRPGKIMEWGPLQLFRIHACRWHRTACPNLVRYRRISFSVRAPGQSHCPDAEPVYPHVSALTSHMSSCLSTLKIGKRQNSRFSDRAPRRSRNQPACASNELQKETRQSTIGRSDNSVITCSRDNAWGVAHEVETVPTTAFERVLERPPVVVWYCAKKMP